MPIDRLPSFQEVLARKTRPPVDLFMFYLFLQREQAEDVLDFWLDVQQHENLCRAYFRDVRKSGKSIKEDWPQYWDYARSRGSIYGNVVGVHSGKRSTASTANITDAEKAGIVSGSRAASPRPATPHGPNPFDSQHLGEDAPHRSTTPFSFRRASAMNKRASRAPTVIPRDTAITRMDLISSAERIYARYLMPGTEKEIYLPSTLRVHSFPLNSRELPRPTSPDYDIESSALAQVPDMFHIQKEYVFRTMEQDAFPRFLRAKAFANLTPVSAFVRLCGGMFCLWAALSTAYTLIFLDIQPKSRRFFLFIPFAFAALFLISYQYELDPILVFFGQSETTPFRLIRIREPYVKKLLFGRALWVSLTIVVIFTVLTIIFWAVPGHRL
ncbi:regulator of G protein signaling [Dacryopinax primogenitus]|uniref:Regulator of G protein signaling n=1 Tax=Dacryopinax primogenitus (strain DJM 731) TaxID=1858805 RepID=M5FU26_DACPD|nr:regulator of G protein signaling [Dacryopinax primogenitus]EJT99673.1 regulator of G protein signaling [Dacryopinax primogenitus]